MLVNNGRPVRGASSGRDGRTLSALPRLPVDDRGRPLSRACQVPRGRVACGEHEREVRGHAEGAAGYHHGGGVLGSGGCEDVPQPRRVEHAVHRRGDDEDGGLEA